MIDIEKERLAFEDQITRDGYVEFCNYSLEKDAGDDYIDERTECAWSAYCQAYRRAEQHQIDDLKAQLEAIKSETCKWRENEDGMWNTACGQDYIFDSYADQKPSDSGQYCSNCGKKIEEVSFEEMK